MNKKVISIGSGVLIAAGTVGFILTGGTEVGAAGIVSGAAVVLAGVVALWNSIKGE